jgi:hypothetical protein
MQAEVHSHISTVYSRTSRMACILNCKEKFRPSYFPLTDYLRLQVVSQASTRITGIVTCVRVKRNLPRVVASHRESLSSHHSLMTTTAATIERVTDVASLARQHCANRSLRRVDQCFLSVNYRLDIYLSLPIYSINSSIVHNAASHYHSHHGVFKYCAERATEETNAIDF